MNLKHTTVESAKIPSTRHNKVGWFENHQKHICLTNRMLPNTLLIGDSIVAGLTRYQDVWKNISSFQKQLIVAYLETRLNMFYGELKTYLFPHLLNLLLFIVEQII